MRQKQLRHHLWLPLLMLIFGWRRRHKSCHHTCDNRGSCSSNIFGPAFVDAAKKCKEDRCLPDCVCSLPEDDGAMCAQTYGKWGWMAPEDSEGEVWKNLDQEVRPKNPINRRDNTSRGLLSLFALFHRTPHDIWSSCSFFSQFLSHHQPIHNQLRHLILIFTPLRSNLPCFYLSRSMKSITERSSRLGCAGGTAGTVSGGGSGRSPTSPTPH
jgi:hypothetical protein